MLVCRGHFSIFFLSNFYIIKPPKKEKESITDCGSLTVITQHDDLQRDSRLGRPISCLLHYSFTCSPHLTMAQSLIAGGCRLQTEEEVKPKLFIYPGTRLPASRAIRDLVFDLHLLLLETESSGGNVCSHNNYVVRSDACWMFLRSSSTAYSGYTMECVSVLPLTELDI